MKKIFGFKQSLMLSSLFLVALSLLISNWVSYIKIKDETINHVKTSSQQLVHSEAKKVETWFAGKATLLNQLAAGHDNGEIDSNYVGTVRLMKSTHDVDGVYIAFDDGRTYSTAVGDAWDNGVADVNKYDARKRPWYSLAKTGTGLKITDVYQDATTGENVISLAKVMQGGVMLVDIALNVLEETVKGVHVPGAVTIITNGVGNILASTSEEFKAGSSLAEAGLGELQSSMLSNGSSIKEYMFGGHLNIAFSQEIALPSGKKWYLLIGIDQTIAYANVDIALKSAIYSSLLVLSLSIAAVLIVINILYRPIILLREMVEDLAQGDGDLTRRLPVNGNDDLSAISQGINTFITTLQSMMIEVLDASVKIDAGIDQLEHEAGANADILNDHTQETDQVVAAIVEMSATASDVAKNGNETAEFTQKTSLQAQESKKVVGEATEVVAQLVQEMEVSAANIEEIGSNTTDITNVLKVIGDIADQTNLLALNAAIEAARAGEFGRGFSVVADEVRALAGKTQKSTTEIEQTLAKLRKGSSTAIDAMEITKITCMRTAEKTQAVAVDLDVIGDSIDQINDLNIQIATAAEEQSSVSEELTRNMTSISDMAQSLFSSGEKSMEQTKKTVQ